MPIRIEEEAVKALIKIVMNRDITLRALPIVALVEAAKHDARFVQRFHQGLALQFGKIARAQFQQVVKAPFGYDQPPIHIKLAKGEGWVEHQPLLRGAIEKFDAERRP